jgi:hypothetical protein
MPLFLQGITKTIAFCQRLDCPSGCIPPKPGKSDAAETGKAGKQRERFSTGQRCLCMAAGKRVNRRKRSPAGQSFPSQYGSLLDAEMPEDKARPRA